MRLTGKWLWGHEISPYGQEMGYLDYGTLAKVVNHVLTNVRCNTGEVDE